MLVIWCSQQNPELKSELFHKHFHIFYFTPRRVLNVPKQWKEELTFTSARFTVRIMANKIASFRSEPTHFKLLRKSYCKNPHSSRLVENDAHKRNLVWIILPSSLDSLHTRFEKLTQIWRSWTAAAVKRFNVSELQVLCLIKKIREPHFLLTPPTPSV